VNGEDEDIYRLYDENEDDDDDDDEQLGDSLTFCGTSLFTSAPLCGAAGGPAALDGGGATAENACAAAATRPTFTAGGAWPLLLPAAAVDPLLLLTRLIPVASMRDAAAGFAITARCAAAVMAVPAAPAPAMVEAEGGPMSIRVRSWPTPAPPTRERRSGLEVKYLQERTGDCAASGV
jgi:hypothetical protein